MDGNAEEFYVNNKGIQILTDTGWSQFSGLIYKGVADVLKITTNHTSLICTADHNIFLQDKKKILSKDLKIGDILYGSKQNEIVTNIVTINKKQKVYDIFNVEKNNRFYANDVLVKNCEFVSADNTLINPMALNNLVAKQPETVTGAVRWYKKIDKHKAYIVSLDPGSGVGKDFSAIQIFEMPSMIQVGEWVHNKTPAKGQVYTLLNILRYIETSLAGDAETNIFWSFENNSYGEGVLALILEHGEENFPGTLINDTLIPKGRAKSYFRRGLYTTKSTKNAACGKLKSFIDSGKMTVNSQGLIYQLKNYVASGVSFAGKPGINDDLVASTLIAIRIMLIIAEWDVFDSSIMKETFDDAEYEPLMPMIFVS